MPETLTLHTKLSTIYEAVGHIKKTGTAPASMGGFKFVEATNVADAVRAELAKLKLTMLPTLIETTAERQYGTKSGGSMTEITIRVTWTLTDGESGEHVTIQSYGTGADAGDKYSPKAQTAAMKYALLMAFLIPTGDDPERQDVGAEKAGPPIRHAPTASTAPEPTAADLSLLEQGERIFNGEPSTLNSETAPDCPHGHGPMASSKYGGWWCRHDYGTPTACKEKVKHD